MIQVRTHYRDVLPHWALVLRLSGGWGGINNHLALHTHTHTHTFIYLQVIVWFYLFNCIIVFVPWSSSEAHFQSFFFFAMGKCPPEISATSAKSTLLGISCSNTFSIDLYQHPRLQSECGWARYNIAWHKILFGVPAIVSYCRQPRKTGRLYMHLHHLNDVRSVSKFCGWWQAANQTDFWFDGFVDRAESEREGETATTPIRRYATITKG